MVFVRAVDEESLTPETDGGTVNTVDLAGVTVDQSGAMDIERAVPLTVVEDGTPAVMDGVPVPRGLAKCLEPRYSCTISVVPAPTSDTEDPDERILVPEPVPYPEVR